MLAADKKESHNILFVPYKYANRCLFVDVDNICPREASKSYWDNII